VTADDASVVDYRGHEPARVRVPDLPVGATVTVTQADASPDCGDNGFTNVATAFATNAERDR
jgi:hypothetical protein